MRAVVLVLGVAALLSACGGRSSNPESSSKSGAPGTAGEAGASHAGAVGTSGAVGAGGASASEGGAAGDDETGSAGSAGSAGAPERLVPWQLEVDGTAPLELGILDTKEHVQCRFLPDEQGQLRCLPWGLAPISKVTRFADEACTQQVYRTEQRYSVALQGHPIALPLVRSNCDPQRYAVGALHVLAPGSAEYGGPACTPMGTVSDDASAVTDMVAATHESPSLYATGTELDGVLVNHRLRVRNVQTAQGTRFYDHLVDEQWGLPCTPTVSGLVQPAAQCLSRTLSTIVYNNAQCGGAPLWLQPACETAAFIHAGATGFALGTPYQGPVYRSGQGCTGISEPPPNADLPDVFYAAGQDLGDAALPEPYPLFALGSVRLEQVGLTADDGGLVTLGSSLNLAWAAYLDRTNGAQGCQPAWGPDGAVRCIPQNFASAFVGIYVDAQCTQPAYWGGGAAAGPVVVEAQQARDAQGRHHVIEVREAKPVSTVYGGAFPGACNALSMSMYVAPGALIPWDHFATLTERNAAPSL